MAAGLSETQTGGTWEGSGSFGLNKEQISRQFTIVTGFQSAFFGLVTFCEVKCDPGRTLVVGLPFDRKSIARVGNAFYF